MNHFVGTRYKGQPGTVLCLTPNYKVDKIVLLILNVTLNEIRIASL